MAIIRLQGEAELRKGIHYELDTTMEPIGVGGMGQVFKGFKVDERTGVSQPVAIKFMFDDLPPNAYERARREASIQLHNDNLIEMLGFLETQEIDAIGNIKKHYHVVSELLEGVSLSDLLAGKTTDRYGKDVPYAVKLLQEYRNDSEHFARTVVMSVVSGLMALHDAGYIHRDIDPSNIMVTSNGHIKLIDFGIAKQMNNLTTGDKGLTVAGKFMGKPEYAAPELALGDIQHQNQTTDIYAVGILLYQCITGHTPFEGPRHEILEKQLKEKIPLSPIKNKALRNIIATACEKKQELRYQSSAQMRVALEQASGIKQATSTKKKLTYIGIAAAIVLLLGIVITMMVTDKTDDMQAVLDSQNEQAELANKKAEFESKINNDMAAASSNFEAAVNDTGKGFDKEMTAALMAVYNDFDRIEKAIREDTLFHLSTEAVREKKKDIVKAMLNVCDRMRLKSDTLMSLDKFAADDLLRDADSIAELANSLR